MISYHPSADNSVTVVIGAVVPEDTYAELIGVAIGGVVGILMFDKLLNKTFRIAIEYENKLKSSHIMFTYFLIEHLTHSNQLCRLLLLN